MKYYQTREVMVGNVGVGGKNPIRIQSMTTSDTRDAQATADQIIKLAGVGCEIVRVTVQGMKEADACEEIKNILVKRGCSIPLVADIHFYPPAAMRVADFADKVRVNPGNYVDRRASFKVIEYDDFSYSAELERLEEKFAPLVEKCKRLKRAIRIGTNHGSLSDRIMNRYGDTAAGMVESALEFTRVCRKLDFHDIIYSMKASNTHVMIEAYRLLVEKMRELGWDYPMHLGVTEAGEGEDGRVKSAIGIGSLLLDGIGDTIRVSLTEDPWCEIPPCKELAQFKREPKHPIPYYPKRHVVIPEPMHRDGTVIGEDCSLEDLNYKTFTDDPATWDPSAEVILFKSKEHEGRPLLKWLHENNVTAPVILNFSYDEKDPTIRAAAEIGSLLCDGLGEGIALDAPSSLAFSILQGSRMRSSKTEFISCPGCGRTLFELQSVAARIREKTSHLPGVKIAIMGCIVNGPGEMADADFGYVGSRPGMIDLYVGKKCIQKNIPMADADKKLVALIKEHGRWVEPVKCLF
ncbi:MAG: (E)-4-hydroxy-3-methylbut-2-enyl-diphosphate synthase [Chlamydiales bacterium]|nr:(E)-4-hydroxy-3-methylbut-2-enyl-diphosphate synthase [Chlamydiales bacterium]